MLLFLASNSETGLFLTFEIEEMFEFRHDISARHKR